MADHSGEMGTTDLEARLVGHRSLCKYGGRRKIDVNVFHIFVVCSLCLADRLNNIILRENRLFLFSWDRIYENFLNSHSKMPSGCCVPNCSKKGCRDEDGLKVSFYKFPD